MMNYVGLVKHDKYGDIPGTGVYHIDGDGNNCIVTIWDYGNYKNVRFSWGYSVEVYSQQVNPTDDIIKLFSDALLLMDTYKTQYTRIDGDVLKVFTYKKPDLDTIERLCVECGLVKSG